MSNDLGDFLRARRADAGLRPPTEGVDRRRTTGLRREEVAAAAGISVDYYIRLEQGRESHPSDAVVDALSRALALSPDGRQHLYRLRGGGSSGAQPTSPEGHELVSRMTALVDAVRPNPAYVLDRLSNVVAANPEGLALHDGIADLPRDRRNTCRYLMTDARAPRIFLDWEEIAQGAVAQLRAANADDLQNHELQALVAELSEQSPLFAQWWGGHLVQRRRASLTRIRTTGAEVVSRRYEVLHLPDEGLRMTLWLPAA